jgi:hypothetical protein
MIIDTPQWMAVKIACAKKGCAMCGGLVRNPPAGDPFSEGPYKGRYFCAECWTLFWDEHPSHLADEESRRYVAEEARQIRLRRGAEILYEEAQARVYLSPRGTLIFDIRSAGTLEPNEFDPSRFQTMMRALQAISGKVAAFASAGEAAAPASA